MPPLGVVEAFDVPEKPDARLLAGGESFAAQQLFLDAGEERLGQGVVSEGAPIDSIERSMPDCCA